MSWNLPPGVRECDLPGANGLHCEDCGVFVDEAVEGLDCVCGQFLCDNCFESHSDQHESEASDGVN